MKNKKVLGIVLLVLFVGLMLGYCASYTAAQTVIRPRVQIQVPVPVPIDRTRYVLKGDGFTDDTDALNAWGRGQNVIYRGRVLGNVLQNGTFLITWRVNLNRKDSVVRFNTFVTRYSGYDDTRIVHYGHRVRQYGNRVVDESPFRQRRQFNRARKIFVPFKISK